MPRPFSLQAVLDLMQTRSDEATQRLARLIATERDAQSRLGMLEQYRDDYAERFRQAARKGLGQPEWRNYQEFLNRLDEAITQQSQVVSLQQQHTAAGQTDWQRQRTRLQAFDALFERHRASEAKLELRLEQKAQDEFAARRRDDETGG
ncbi:MAG: flagellar export protein FliJ [Candidatus Accumulibacter sp.]|nr:flagellar export protein FliJ [Accumulibacter sp.]